MGEQANRGSSLICIWQCGQSGCYRLNATENEVRVASNSFQFRDLSIPLVGIPITTFARRLTSLAIRYRPGALGRSEKSCAVFRSLELLSSMVAALYPRLYLAILFAMIEGVLLCLYNRGRYVV